MYLTDLAIRIRMSNVSWERDHSVTWLQARRPAGKGRALPLSLSGHGFEAIRLKPFSDMLGGVGDDVARHHRGQ